jgi:hypothetical protein
MVSKCKRKLTVDTPVTLIVKLTESLNDRLIGHCMRTERPVDVVVARAIELFLEDYGD